MIDLTCTAWLVTLVLIVVIMFLILRVSAFRTDRPKSDSYFGVPYMLNWTYFNSANFRREGHAILHLLWLATAAFVLTSFYAFVRCPS